MVSPELINLKRRRLRYFAANGFIFGLILSAIYQSYILTANWRWTPPEPWFVIYIKGFFVLLFVILTYGIPVYFYWKHTTLISKKEFVISWGIAWLVFCIYSGGILPFIYSGLMPDDVSILLDQFKNSLYFLQQILILAMVGKMALLQVIWYFILGSFISAIILLPFITYIYKRKAR